MIEDKEFSSIKGEWHVKVILKDNKLFIQTVSDISMEHYDGQMDEESIKNDKNFDFLFDNPSNLFAFLETSFSQLTISPGKISFIMEMPLGKIIKKMELSIPTKRKQVDQLMLRDMKLRKMQGEMETIKLQNQELKQKMGQSEQQMGKLIETFKKFEQTLEQKDEVINSIFVELKQIRQWKQQKQVEQMSKQKRKFIADPTNSHNAKFVQAGNRFKKSGGGSWEILMCKNQIEKNDIYRYTIRQLKAGTGGSFMYGIGTSTVKGIIRAQDNKQFIGYYENTGNIYDRGESRKGGPRIKDGDLIIVEINTKSWTISWTIEGVKEAEVTIHGELKNKPIFLSIVIYNDEAQLEFM